MLGQQDAAVGDRLDGTLPLEVLELAAMDVDQQLRFAKQLPLALAGEKVRRPPQVWHERLQQVQLRPAPRELARAGGYRLQASGCLAREEGDIDVTVESLLPMPAVPRAHVAELQQARGHTHPFERADTEPVDVERACGALGDARVLLEPARARLLGADRHTTLQLGLARMPVGHQ